MMTEDEIRAILERAKAATSGPWTWVVHCPEINFGARIIAHGRPIAVADFHDDGSDERNLAFSAAARTDVERLAEHALELRRVLEMVEWAEFGVCPWCSGWHYGKGHAPACPRQMVLGLP